MINLKHTPESVRALVYDQCHKSPGITIEDLLRSAVGGDNGWTDDVTEKTPLAEVLKLLYQNPTGLVAQAILGMRAGDMAGEIEANENTAKGLADKILVKLTETGQKMTKDQMCAIVFTGVTAVSGLDNRPQDAADFKEALSILVGNANVKRWTSKDTPAEKRWETMQVPKPAKTEKSKQ